MGDYQSDVTLCYLIQDINYKSYILSEMYGQTQCIHIFKTDIDIICHMKFNRPGDLGSRSDLALATNCLTV